MNAFIGSGREYNGEYLRCRSLSYNGVGVVKLTGKNTWNNVVRGHGSPAESLYEVNWVHKSMNPINFKCRYSGNDGRRTMVRAFPLCKN